MTKLEKAARQSFETWWEREGQEFLFALNTTTDDDIKLVAEVAWKNGAYCAEQAEQPVSQEYQDHLVNQSFDWAAMAAKHQLMEGYRIGLAEMREKCAKVCEKLQNEAEAVAKCFDATAEECAAAIRAINFEGDTGFRHVSEMIAEKADGEQWSPDDMAYRPSGLSMEQAEQEPVCCETYGCAKPCPKYYAAPVHTKDLTDDEIWSKGSQVRLTGGGIKKGLINYASAVIAADRRKNK